MGGSKDTQLWIKRCRGWLKREKKKKKKKKKKKSLEANPESSHDGLD